MLRNIRGDVNGIVFFKGGKEMKLSDSYEFISILMPIFCFSARIKNHRKSTPIERK